MTTRRTADSPAPAPRRQQRDEDTRLYHRRREFLAALESHLDEERRELDRYRRSIVFGSILYLALVALSTALFVWSVQTWSPGP